MDTTIKTEISHTFDELIRTFSAFTPEQVNSVPFAGSWTPGQVAEHILKSSKGLPKMLLAETEPGTRPADEKIPAIRNLFLDMSLKMKSPEFNQPSAGPHDKQVLLDSFLTVKNRLEEASSMLDLSAVCKQFEMPGFGFLTRLEWLAFVSAHTQRHTHQLKNIFQILRPAH